MPSPEQLARAARPRHGAVLITVECQQGVVGRDSALPELAAARKVVGCPAARRPAGRGRAREQGCRWCTRWRNAAPTGGAPTATPGCSARPNGSPSSSTPAHRAVSVASRSRSPTRTSSCGGCTASRPSPGTDVDALLRNLGCRTLIVTGVSANVAIPNAVFDAVNLGYTVVVPADAIAGVPADYTPAMIRNTLALVATVDDHRRGAGLPPAAAPADAASRQRDGVSARP